MSVQEKKLENMIKDAVQSAIWEYEHFENESVDNIEFYVNGSIEDGDTFMTVDVYNIGDD